MSVIQNALTGALAAQTALNTASQNIANVMTPGYTRQGVVIASVQARESGVLTAGNGVKVSSLIRFSDSYKSLQMWQANASLGQYSTAQPYLTQLEQVMGDDSSNINSGLDAFFRFFEGFRGPGDHIPYAGAAVMKGAGRGDAGSQDASVTGMLEGIPARPCGVA
jgi:flagellar hook-associated protein FlgK